MPTMGDVDLNDFDPIASKQKWDEIHQLQKYDHCSVPSGKTNQGMRIPISA